MASRRSKTESSRPAEKVPYKPTERERDALAKLLNQSTQAAPRLKVTKDGQHPALTLDHPQKEIGYALLMEALGTTDHDFPNQFLSLLANAGSQGPEIDAGKINFMLSIVKGIGPRDQIEAMLAAQMAAVHIATMTFARRLAHVENTVQQDSAERAFNKLARTFAAQMETLKRYRVGGEQKVTVQHVTVGHGGQAIVGNVTQRSTEEASKETSASPPLLADAKPAPMPIIQETDTRAAAPLARVMSTKKKR